jgi:hypothetical protein
MKKSVTFSPIYLHASPKETDEKSVIFAEENMTAVLVLPFIPNRLSSLSGLHHNKVSTLKDARFYSRSPRAANR